MIKKLLLSSLVATLAIANTNVVDSAMEHYKNKEYAKALVEFEKISTFAASSSVDFYIGRSHYELGNYEQALIAYERFLINNPNHKRAQLEIAQTYSMLGLHDEALSRFRALLNDPEIPDAVKSNILRRVSHIESLAKKHHWQATAIFGLGYDDNIDNTSGVNSYSVYIPALGTSLDLTPNSKRDSYFYDTGLVINHLYKHSEELALRNSATLYYQEYDKDSSKTTSMVALNSAAIINHNGINYTFKFGYDHVWYDSSSYLDVYHFTPSLSTVFQDTMLYDLSLKIAKKEFTSEHKNKDSMQYDLVNSLKIQTQEFGIMGFELLLGQENRQRAVRTDVSKDYYGLKLTNSYSFTSQLNLSSSIAFHDAKYKYRDANFLSKRDDKRYNLGLNLGYRYNPKTTFGVSYNYINQDSNHAPFDYDKNVVKTYLYYTF